VLYCIQ